VRVGITIVVTIIIVVTITITLIIVVTITITIIAIILGMIGSAAQLGAVLLILSF